MSDLAALSRALYTFGSNSFALAASLEAIALRNSLTKERNFVFRLMFSRFLFLDCLRAFLADFVIGIVTGILTHLYFFATHGRNKFLTRGHYFLIFNTWSQRPNCY